jgi:hypothetical protein
MFLRVALVAVGAALLFVACNGSGPNYAKTVDDDKVDLESMALQDADMPAGMTRVQEKGFNNDEWSQALPTDDPEGAKTLLDAQGRLRNFVALFSWDNPNFHLGRTVLITTQSTLYVDADAASKAKTCDLRISDTDPIEDFKVPHLGDQSFGFFVNQDHPDFGSLVDTTICFRTGRVMHSIQLTGLDGTQDISLAVRLATRMLARVDGVYEGKPLPTDSPLATETPTP